MDFDGRDDIYLASDELKLSEKVGFAIFFAFLFLIIQVVDLYDFISTAMERVRRFGK